MPNTVKYWESYPAMDPTRTVHKLYVRFDQNDVREVAALLDHCAPDPEGTYYWVSDFLNIEYETGVFESLKDARDHIEMLVRERIDDLLDKMENVLSAWDDEIPRTVTKRQKIGLVVSFLSSKDYFRSFKLMYRVDDNSIYSKDTVVAFLPDDTDASISNAIQAILTFEQKAQNDPTLEVNVWCWQFKDSLSDGSTSYSEEIGV